MRRTKSTKCLMQDPELTESMFTDLKNLAAFRALASTATFEAAIAAADPGAADLLLQLSVADFEGDPDDAVASPRARGARAAPIAASTTPIDPRGARSPARRERTRFAARGHRRSC